MCITDRHDMTLVVKVALNLNTTSLFTCLFVSLLQLLSLFLFHILREKKKKKKGGKNTLFHALLFCSNCLLFFLIPFLICLSSHSFYLSIPLFLSLSFVVSVPLYHSFQVCLSAVSVCQSVSPSLEILCGSAMECWTHDQIRTPLNLPCFGGSILG